MYKVIFKNSAERLFRKLDKFDQQRIVKKLRLLRQNPFLGKPLIGNLAGSWSLRIGKYRIIYQIKYGELIILVLDIGHRKNIY
ncbi:type II toxin-antitoxin system RelE/ParE family toxin [Candidatus Pacearchaeota archaeon]|nr:type II toxin-antitoxin system RelE/ParE family toxin [Candidatus Pacearchaeota archaeon]